MLTQFNGGFRQAEDLIWCGEAAEQCIEGEALVEPGNTNKVREGGLLCLFESEWSRKHARVTGVYQHADP